MICGLCVDTIQSILDDPDKSVSFNQALFDAFPEQMGPSHDDLKDRFIARFRYRMIGSLNYARWLNMLKDRTVSVRDRALTQWEILQANKADFADMAAGSAEFEDVMLREEMPFSVPVSPTGRQYVRGRDTHTVKSKSYQDLNTSTVKQAMRDVPDWWEIYLSQFDDLFLERV